MKKQKAQKKKEEKINYYKIKNFDNTDLRPRDNPTSLRVNVKRASVGWAWSVTDWFGVCMIKGKAKTSQEAWDIAAQAKKKIKEDAIAQTVIREEKQRKRKASIFENSGVSKQMKFGRKFDE